MMFTARPVEQFTGNCVARALYDNIAETPDELAFRKGDVLTVLEQNTSGLEGWWLCMLRGRQGICPANRLRLIARVYDTGGNGSPLAKEPPMTTISAGLNRQARPGLLSAAVRAHQQKQLIRPPVVTSLKQQPPVYPEDCYDQPRSLDPTYQEPRPAHPVLPRQLSADVSGHEVASADYDVPRPHHIRVRDEVRRNLSVDSSCEYDVPVPRPASSTETYDTPRSVNNLSSGGGSPSPPDDCYDVPSGPAVRVKNNKNLSDRSSGVSLFSSVSSESSSSSSSSAARSASSEDSLSLSSAVGHISGRSSRSSIGILSAVEQQNQSMELYDVLPPPVPAQQQPLPVQEETYNVPRPAEPVEPDQADIYQIPPPPVATKEATPPIESEPVGQLYDVIPPARPLTVQQETYDSPKPLINLSAKASTLPLSLDSALETVKRLDAEVSSALSNLLTFWQTASSVDWAELQLRVLRLRASLQELCDFARGAIGNAVRRDDSLAVRLARLLRPLQDANAIVQKTSQSWTDLFALNNRRRPWNNGDLDQLLACCRNMDEDMRQVIDFIRANVKELFSSSSTGGSPPSPPAAGTDDYDYVNLESKAKSDQENEEVKSTLPSNEMKRAFEVLVTQSDTLPVVLPDTDKVSENDRSVVEFYGDQVETYVSYLSNAIDSFIQTIEHNQPPKVFVAYSKFVILNAHKLLCVGDTVHRNVSNAKLRSTVLERSNKLCQGLQTCVQSTKKAGREFPSVSAVQGMLDSVLAVSKLAQELRTCLLQPMQCRP